MPYRFSLNMLPLMVAAAISGLLALYTWRNRKTAGATPFAVLMFILFEWGTSYILELAGTNLQTKFFWDEVKFVGVTATPVAWLIFALEYTGRKTWITVRRLILLYLLPFTTVVIIFTSKYQDLFLSSERLTAVGGFLILQVDNGPWFWVHALYTYLLIMIGLVLIIRALLRWPAQYRGQMILLLFSTLTPLIANVITIFQILPILIDLTPYAFTVTGIGMAYALFRHRLLDIAPIARDIVIDGMKDGTIILDTESRIVDLNRAAQQMINLYGEPQPIGKPLANVLSRWSELVNKYRNVNEAGDEISLGDGKNQRWYELHLSTLRDGNESLLGRVILVRDITDRKLAENRLHESEARFRQIVENASDMIYRVDMDGCITYVNPSVLRVLGFEHEKELIGRYYLNLAAPEARHKIKRTYQLQLAGKTPNTYNEFPIITATGREVWFGQNVQLILQDNKVVGFQALARDITDIKQAQEALRLARDQALEASRAKSQLLSKVSHELRTPLGGVLGYAELLRDDTFGEINEGQRKAVLNVIESANYLNTMVSELLDESQIQANTTILQEKLFSPVTLLQQSASGLEVLAGKKGLQFHGSIEENVPKEIVGDARRLRQIIINLAGNAIKFTNEGSVHVDFLRPNDEYWAIQVKDTGAGISKEAQEYIFEPFRQVKDEVTRDNRGIGLGLSITKQLVELMGGRIVLESTLGEGSAFTIFLPINKETGGNS